MHWLLLIQAFASCSLAGLILFVQFIHYPLFAAVGPEQFVRYESSHRRRVSRVVIPLMGAELITALWLLVRAPGLWQALGAGLVAALWLLTLLLAAPLHLQLSWGFDRRLLDRLLLINGIRTLLWLGRAALALGLLAAA